MIPQIRPVSRARVKAARIAVAAIDGESAEQAVEEAALGLLHRRREPSGRLGPRRMRQCNACRAFVSNPSRPCGACGYLDGVGFAA